MDSAFKVPHTWMRVNTPAPERTWKGASPAVSEF
ncbi:mCG148187 [Mus musculus]|nr:mCG148187 [Mus musculus]